MRPSIAAGRRLGVAWRIGPRGLSVILLCFAAGTTDALSYLTLGHVFTSAMTGCAALLCLKLASGNYAVVLRAGIALSSYLVGCAVATVLQPRDKAQLSTPRVLRRLMGLEFLLLLFYAVSSDGSAGAARVCWLIFLSATAMGVQSIVARDLHESGVSTVVLNPTMTRFGMTLTDVALGRVRSLPGESRLQALVMLAYAGGATVTAFGVLDHSGITSLLPLAAVGGVFLLSIVPGL
ncbi:MAG: DUF1275 domain-containing protein [Rhodospirillales bacterium]|nr:DUF1275 domain-containing protein [Rhodospirillales bacterium]